MLFCYPETWNMTEPEIHTLSRRRFIAASSAAGVSLTLLLSSLWSVWRFLAPGKQAGEQGRVTIPRADVPPGKPHFFHFRGHPAVVMQPEPGQFIALSAVCTHLGCIVDWRPDDGIFLCPCHAGKFSRTGKVLSGPPPKPLPSYPVEVRNNELMIG